MFPGTSLGNDPVGLASPVTMRGVTAAYLFANTLVTLEVTEEVIRRCLERCAAYFELENGRPKVSAAFLQPKVEHYNYDFFAGLDYAFDLRRPVGQRVVRLARLDGSPLGPGPLRLCTSNYRGHRHRRLRSAAGTARCSGGAAWSCRTWWPATSATTARLARWKTPVSR